MRDTQIVKIARAAALAGQGERMLAEAARVLAEADCGITSDQILGLMDQLKALQIRVESHLEALQ